METETKTRPVWVDPHRFLAFCSTCDMETEPDDTRDPRWCGTCGDKRDN